MNSQKVVHHYALFAGITSLLTWVLKDLKINLENAKSIDFFYSNTYINDWIEIMLSLFNLFIVITYSEIKIHPYLKVIIIKKKKSLPFFVAFVSFFPSFLFFFFFVLIAKNIRTITNCSTRIIIKEEQNTWF